MTLINKLQKILTHLSINLPKKIHTDSTYDSLGQYELTHKEKTQENKPFARQGISLLTAVCIASVGVTGCKKEVDTVETKSDDAEVVVMSAAPADDDKPAIVADDLDDVDVPLDAPVVEGDVNNLNNHDVEINQGGIIQEGISQEGISDSEMSEGAISEISQSDSK